MDNDDMIKNLENMTKIEKKEENNDENNNGVEDHKEIPLGFEKKRTPDQLEDIWKNMREVPNSVKCIYCLLGIASIGSLFMLIVGIILQVSVASTLSKLLIGFGVVALFVFLFGCFACYKYNARVEVFLMNEKTVNVESIDQSLERNLLNAFMFLIMFLFIIFAIIAIGSFASQKKIQFEVKALSVNEETWKKHFGDLTVDFVLNKLTTIVMTTAVLAFIYCFLVGIVIWYILNMLGFYRAIQTIIQFICLLFFTVGWILLYFSIYGMRYKDITGSGEGVPIGLPIALFSMSIICLFLSIIGFSGAYLEKLEVLNVFFWTNIAFKIVIIILTIVFFVFADKFSELFEDNCSSLLNLVNEKYLIENIGCERKYVFSSTNLSDMICPKDRIVWKKERKEICLDVLTKLVVYPSMQN
jgi:hypothetical protein